MKLKKPIDTFAVAMEAHLRLDKLQADTEAGAKEKGAAIDEVKRELAELRSATLANAQDGRNLVVAIAQLIGAMGLLIETMQMPKTRVVTAQLPSGPVTMTSSERRQ